MQNDISFKYILKLAVPAILAGIAEPILSITDTAFIGNIPNNATVSLAAVGIAGSFIAAITWILAQTRSATSAIISQYYGAAKLQEVRSLPTQILMINFLLSILIYIITVIFIETIFGFYNAKDEILNNAIIYYKIRAIGLPFTLITFTFFGVFRGLQNTFYPMVISIIGMLINIFLDYFFIFGFQRLIPPMGIQGAAYASIIAQVFMTVFALYLFLKKTPFKLQFSLSVNPEIKRLLSLSFNLFIRTLSLNIALYLANAYATKYGKDYIAAQTIAFQIWLFFAFFIDGFSSVGNIVSGKLLGQNNFNKLNQLNNKLIRYTIIISVFLGLLCLLFYHPIGLLFTKDKNVLSLFYAIFWMVLIMQPINAIAFVLDGVFKGLAEAKTLRNVLLIATFLGFVPTLLISDYYNLKLYGVWLAFTIWMLLRAFILYVIFKKKYTLIEIKKQLN